MLFLFLLLFVIICCYFIKNIKIEKYTTDESQNYYEYIDMPLQTFINILKTDSYYDTNLKETSDVAMLKSISGTVYTPVSFNLEPYLSPVLDQYNCGCCYACALICILNYLYRIDIGGEELSVQQIIDCCFMDGIASGCNGGSIYNIVDKYFNTERTLSYNSSYNFTAYRYTNIKYPKTNYKQNCINVKDNVGITIGPLKCYMLTNEEYDPILIKKIIVRNGPISLSCGIPTDDITIFRYKNVKGVTFIDYLTDDGSDKGYNHVMLITGWDFNRYGEYWIIRNSYGKNWGDNGYFYIYFNKLKYSKISAVIQVRNCIPNNPAVYISLNGIYCDDDEEPLEMILTFVGIRTTETQNFYIKIRTQNDIIYWSTNSIFNFVDLKDDETKSVITLNKKYYTGNTFKAGFISIKAETSKSINCDFFNQQSSMNKYIWEIMFYILDKKGSLVAQYIKNIDWADKNNYFKDQ